SELSLRRERAKDRALALPHLHEDTRVSPRPVPWSAIAAEIARFAEAVARRLGVLQLAPMIVLQRLVDPVEERRAQRRGRRHVRDEQAAGRDEEPPEHEPGPQ